MSADNNNHSGIPATNQHSPSRLFAWVPLLVFALLACAIGGTGFFVFSQYQQRVKKEAHDALGAIANLKVRRVAEWREENMRHARVLAHDPLLALEIERWLRRGMPLDEGAQRILQRLKAMQQAYGFQAAFVLDERGIVRDLPITPDAKPPTAYGVGLVMEAMRTRQAILTDLHPGAGAPRVRLDLVVPIFAGGDEHGRAIAGVYFRIDPQQYLFPLLQSWPTPSPSAETFLVRREGDEVVYLNNLRHRDNTALQLRISVNDKDLLAAKMARGTGGLAMEGKDYRGIPSIAAAIKVPDSPWFIIAKMDKEELYAPIRRSAWIMSVLVFTFIAGAGGGAGLWWRQQRAQFLVRHYEGKLKRQVLEQKYNALTRYANDIILMMDDTGRIIEANERAIQAYGHSRDELLRMNVRDLQAPEALASFAVNWDRCGVEGLVYETVHRHADQSVFPVEVSARSIETEGKHFRQAIIRDITERKQAEQQLRLDAQVFEDSREAIFVTDAQNNIVSVNQAFIEITGYDRAEAIGQSPSLLKSGRHDADFFRSMMNSIHQSGHWRGEIWNRRKNGEIYPAWMAISAVRNEQGEITHYVAIYSDISELKAAEENLRLWARAMESSVNAIFIVDARQENYPVFYVNPAFERTTGFSSKEVVGKSCRLLDSGELNQPQIGEIYQAIREQHDGSAVLRSYRKDGSLFWFELFFSPVRDESGKVTHFVGALNDITERKSYESQLERQANYDELTGLANRNLFQDRLNQALAFSHRHDCGLAVLFIDLDYFKNINDSLGHDAGDALLTQVASRLSCTVREGDTVARQGGDEFVLLLPEIRAEDDISVITQKLVKAMSAPFDIGGHELHITCSIGIASYPKDGEDRQTLLKNADAAMYRAKEMGRNNAQYYAEEMNVKAMERLMLENSLYHALECNEFLLHYQPQVDLRTGEITGMEALVRWRHPELGLVSPARFIPVAEESGLIVPLGEWVLRTACAQNKAWQRAGLKPISVAVNLSARQFRQPNLVEMVASILKETDLDPAHLELELTESLVMQNVEVTIATMGRLKAMGIKLSIDDFGTGYSSLSYLKRFPIHTLKIDQSFVRDIITDPSDAAIAKTIIAMAHELGLMVIAEGVETEEQKFFLRLHRCDEMQGYFFSRPMPAAEFEILLREGRCLQNDEAVADLSQRTLLLLDDEENILTSLTRLLRRDGYKILRATNAAAALDLLAQNPVGVIISDQRMPEMSGVEFLRRVKQIYPDTVRMVLSGYTDLKSVTDAINEGAVYKFLTKPWEDDLLRANIREAFQRYELAQDNQRLTDEMAAINEELNRAKRELEKRVEQKTSEVRQNVGVLQISQEMLEYLPVGVVGVDEDGLIAVANRMANEMFDADRLPLVGPLAAERLPRAMIECLAKDGERHAYQFENGRNVIFWSHSMGASSGSEGRVLVIVPNEQDGD